MPPPTTIRLNGTRLFPLTSSDLYSQGSINSKIQEMSSSDICATIASINRVLCNNPNVHLRLSKTPTECCSFDVYEKTANDEGGRLALTRAAKALEILEKRAEAIGIPSIHLKQYLEKCAQEGQQIPLRIAIENKTNKTPQSHDCKIHHDLRIAIKNKTPQSHTPQEISSFNLPFHVLLHINRLDSREAAAILQKISLLLQESRHENRGILRIIVDHSQNSFAFECLDSLNLATQSINSAAEKDHDSLVFQAIAALLQKADIPPEEEKTLFQPIQSYILWRQTGLLIDHKNEEHLNFVYSIIPVPTVGLASRDMIATKIQKMSEIDALEIFVAIQSALQRHPNLYLLLSETQIVYHACCAFDAHTKPADDKDGKLAFMRATQALQILKKRVASRGYRTSFLTNYLEKCAQEAPILLRSLNPATQSINPAAEKDHDSLVFQAIATLQKSELATSDPKSCLQQFREYCANLSPLDKWILKNNIISWVLSHDINHAGASFLLNTTNGNKLLGLYIPYPELEDESYLKNIPNQQFALELVKIIAEELPDTRALKEYMYLALSSRAHFLRLTKDFQKIPFSGMLEFESTHEPDLGLFLDLVRNAYAKLPDHQSLLIKQAIVEILSDDKTGKGVFRLLNATDSTKPITLQYFLGDQSQTNPPNGVENDTESLNEILAWGVLKIVAERYPNETELKKYIDRELTDKMRKDGQLLIPGLYGSDLARGDEQSFIKYVSGKYIELAKHDHRWQDSSFIFFMVAFCLDETNKGVFRLVNASDKDKLIGFEYIKNPESPRLLSDLRNELFACDIFKTILNQFPGSALGNLLDKYIQRFTEDETSSESEAVI